MLTGDAVGTTRVMTKRAFVSSASYSAAVRSSPPGGRPRAWVSRAPPPPSSEAETHRHLHDARSASLRRLAEVRIHLLAGRVELRRRVDHRPVDGVEQVVDLPAELHPPLATELEVLEHREV